MANGIPPPRTTGGCLNSSRTTPYALNNLGLYLVKTDPQTALRYAEQALEHFPTRPPIMDTAARCGWPRGTPPGPWRS
jgi:phytoene dehydrogenase-like protein